MAGNPEVPEDIEVKVASNAAQDFIESYYPALNVPSGRAKLTSFYLKATPACKADISLNGTVLADPTALQNIFEKDVQKCLYDVQSFDCQVVNNNYTVGAPEGTLSSEKDGKKMSIMVMVSGSVKYWAEGDDGEVRGFVDNVLLVPNWEAQGSKASKGDKKWLIQNQTFRVVL